MKVPSCFYSFGNRRLKCAIFPDIPLNKLFTQTAFGVGLLFIFAICYF